MELENSTLMESGQFHSSLFCETLVIMTIILSFTEVQLGARPCVISSYHQKTSVEWALNPHFSEDRYRKMK